MRTMDAAEHQMQMNKNRKIEQHQQQQPVEPPLAHNGQNNHNKRRCSKVPVRELPEAMPPYQHPIYPQLYTIRGPSQTCYKWDCIILDLDRTIIHGKRLSVKRWRKYVENGTIPSLAENQCGKWHRHIHRKGHQMHPFIRGRTMIYYRPFTWHLLAVLDYLKSHFGTKIIVCTKAGEHYAASVLAALISNFTSANPDLIDDVYNFHDLHDDEEDEGKPKKPFRLICNRHDLDPKKTLIVDDNATSWFGQDRLITNFWMPPCYGYQIHDIDNELQLLCKYLWDPIQQNHLKKKTKSVQQHQHQQQLQHQHEDSDPDLKRTKRYQEEQNLKINHIQHHSQGSDTTDSSISPNSSPKLMGRASPKSINSGTSNSSPKNQRYLNSPNSKLKYQHQHQHQPQQQQQPQYVPSAVTVSNLKMQKSISSSYSVVSDVVDNNDRMNPHHIYLHNKHNNPQKVKFSDLLDGADDCNEEPLYEKNITSIARISRNYNKRKYKGQELIEQHSASQPQLHQQSHGYGHAHGVVPQKRHSNPNTNISTKLKSPKADATKTKKKYFFESKSRGSKKLAKIIGK